MLMAGERRRVTTRIALDALLLVLSRAHLERLLELHPSLHERVAALLMRRLKDAMQVALGVTPPQRSEIVALQGWRSGMDREAFVDALVGALERELGREVAFLTVAPSRHSSVMPGRRNRHDGVVVREASEGRCGSGSPRSWPGVPRRHPWCWPPSTMPGGRGGRPHGAGGHRARSDRGESTGHWRPPSRACRVRPRPPPRSRSAAVGKLAPQGRASR